MPGRTFPGSHVPYGREKSKHQSQTKGPIRKIEKRAFLPFLNLYFVKVCMDWRSSQIDEPLFGALFLKVFNGKRYKV